MGYRPVAMAGARSASVRFDALVRDRVARGADGPDVTAAIGAALDAAPEDEGELYDLLDERTDPSRLRPRLADDIELKRFPLRWGNDYAMAANPRAMLFFRLEP